MSACTSASEAFFSRFWVPKGCKSDPAEVCFDVAGVRRTAIFHKSSSTVFYQIWEPEMIPKMDPKSTQQRSKNGLKIASKSCPMFLRLLVPSWLHLGSFWGPKSLPKASLGMPEPQRSPKSAPRRRLGASSGCLGASWGRLGAVLGHLGAILGLSWAVLGPSWREDGER